VKPADTVPGYVSRLKVRHASQFRILQFSDLHFFAGRDPNFGLMNPATVKDMTQLVKRAKPDLLIITGDLWRDSPEPRREEFMRFAVAQCESLGVPWAFTWGNHDQLNDFKAGHETFARARHSLYRGAATDGNYVIDIVGPRGRLIWQILCINTDADGLRDQQQQWLRSLAEDLRRRGVPDVPRFAFFHIPLKQYAEVWKNDSASGVKGEEPCIEKEDGSSLPILKLLGVRVCFCGHDHENDYSGVIDGVELVYGRATGAGGYGDNILRKGAKLVKVNGKTGRYTWRTLFPDGTQWVPKKGERIDKTGHQ
jgi:hypothetical protein